MVRKDCYFRGGVERDPWYAVDWWLLINQLSLREKCPNTEFFLVRIFLYSDWIRKFTSIWTLFKQCVKAPVKMSIALIKMSIKMKGFKFLCVAENVNSRRLHKTFCGTKNMWKRYLPNLKFSFAVYAKQNVYILHFAIPWKPR